MPYLNKDQQREAQRLWMMKRREDWIESQGGKCAICGGNDRLEVDHIDPAQKQYNPALLWSRRAEFREAELVKCQVLCKDCHQAKTTAYVAVEYQHGTFAMYNKRGCRCDDCKRGCRDFWRAKRAAAISG